LNEGRKASINAVSKDLGVSRFSARRSLTTMKDKGLVKDQPAMFASGVVPGIVAHGFLITDKGRSELGLLQSFKEHAEPYPLGYRILVYMSHGVIMTVGQIAKMLGKDRGHVGRVIKSLHRAGLIDCLYSKTRTSFGQDMITHLYRITDLGRQVLNAGPEAYLRLARSRTCTQMQS